MGQGMQSLGGGAMPPGGFAAMPGMGMVGMQGMAGALCETRHEMHAQNGLEKPAPGVLLLTSIAIAEAALYASSLT